MVILNCFYTRSNSKLFLRFLYGLLTGGSCENRMFGSAFAFSKKYRNIALQLFEQVSLKTFRFLYLLFQIISGGYWSFLQSVMQHIYKVAFIIPSLKTSCFNATEH